MYRVTLQPRKLLITTDEVIAMAPTEDQVSIRLMLSSIQIAEDRFIKPVLGKEFYNAFRNMKNVVVTDDNKDDLEEKVNEGNNSEEVHLKVGEIVNAIELVTDEWYVQLWNEYLWKLEAEAITYTATPVNYSRFTASGEVFNNPRGLGLGGQGSASVDVKEIQWKMDKLLMDRIDPIIAPMKEWLFDYKEHFPLYAKILPVNKKPEDGISMGRKSGWVHGIYDKPRRDCDDD